MRRPSPALQRVQCPQRSARWDAYYIASQDVNEAGVFHLSEGWSDKAALDAHTSSADFQAMLAQAMKLRILSREIYLSHSQGRTLAA